MTALTLGATRVAPNVAIDARALTKRFGATLAVDAVSLAVDAGKIHAIVGENGAGKSTVLGILSGRISPTDGSVAVFGDLLRFGDPRESRRLGVASIYQELTMVPALSAAANVFLGQELGPGPVLSRRKMRSRFERLCDDFEVRIDPAALARDLPISSQQILEIMRAVAGSARIMLFDEPTAALPEHEREATLGLIRRLSDQGVTVVFVSHHLDEVFAISDRVSVMRNGVLTETRERDRWTERELVHAMLGRDVESTTKRARSRDGRVALRAEGVTVPGAIKDVTLSVNAGEVVGLGGLVGSGRSTLMRSIAGLEPTSRGRLWLDDKEVTWPRTPQAALQYGIAMVPEDRKRQGLVLGMAVADNVTLTDLGSVSRLWVIIRRRQDASAARVLERFGVRPTVLRQSAASLSGGNQQRVLISKWLYRNPRVLLADEPTRGIDVGAKAEVLDGLQTLAGAGMSIIIASSELEEVLAVSDRVVVLADGEAVDELANHDGQLSVADILQRAFRVADPEALRRA